MLKKCVSRKSCACLDAKVGGMMVRLGTAALIKDQVCFQGKRTLLHCVMYPKGGRKEPWVFSTEDMSPIGFMQHLILVKEKYHWWD